MMAKKKIILGVAVWMLACSALAQKYSVHRKDRVFLGVYGGVNYSLPDATEKHAVLVADPQSADGLSEKDYNKLFENGSHQFGMYFLYCMSKRFSLVFQPAYYTERFKYQTAYSWRDTVNYMDFSRELHHDQKIAYFSLPLLVRWDMSLRQVSPYIQLGVYTDFRHRASKSISYDATIDGELNEDQLNSTSSAMATDHFNKFNVGLVGGLGISYFSKYFVIGIESNFRYGLLPVVNERNRYSDQTGFTAQYLDVLDQLKLSNLNFQMKVLFPIDNLRELNILRRSKY